jgi:hypothetical protein
LVFGRDIGTTSRIGGSKVGESITTVVLKTLAKVQLETGSTPGETEV